MRRRGFTLVEILVTIVIVGTALTAILQALALGVRAGGSADRRTIAGVMLGEAVARIETGEIPLTEDSEGEWPEVAEGFRWKVEVETPGAPADLVHATITVTWGADDNGEAPAGSRTAVRWLYKPPAAATGGVTRGPNLGGGR